MEELHGFKWFFLSMFLLLLVAESVIHMVTALTNDYLIAMNIIPNYNSVLALIGGNGRWGGGGYLIAFSEKPLFFQFFNRIGYFKYDNANFMFNQFHKQPNGTLNLSSFDMDAVDMEKNAIVLMGLVKFHQLVFFILLFVLHTGKGWFGNRVIITV